MTLLDTLAPTFQLFRARTAGLLTAIEKLPDPRAALGWRPGPSRAHIAWQVMHIGVTEEIFATERLMPSKAGEYLELWPRFRGGSKPDDQIPSLDEIRRVLDGGRAHLLATLTELGDARLGEIPAALAERKLTVRDVYNILLWHEAHHQGQAHITLNLFKAAHGIS